MVAAGFNVLSVEFGLVLIPFLFSMPEFPNGSA
jgi:hypothetical protein